MNIMRRCCASLLAISFCSMHSPADASIVRVLFESNEDRVGGSEVAIISYPSLANFLSHTGGLTDFSAIDVSSSFSIGGLAYDGSGYHVLFESNDDRVGGSEVAVISYPSLANFLSHTGGSTGFSAIDVSSSFSIGGFTFDGSNYHVLFESDDDRVGGSEVAVISYPSLANFLSHTGGTTSFSAIDVSPLFSIGGFTFDGSNYHVLFESNDDRVGGSEVAVISYPSLANFLSHTGGTTSFSAIDVSSSFSVRGFTAEPQFSSPGPATVPEPSTLAIWSLVSIASLGFARNRTVAAASSRRGTDVPTRARSQA